jgi:pre-mRNA-splicing factor 38A
MAWTAGYTLTFMDEFVDSLLVEERVCDIILPRLQKRQILEENGDIGPRKSRLLDAMEGNSDHGGTRGRSRSRSITSGRPRSGSNESRGSARYISRSPSRNRSGSPGSPHGLCRGVPLCQIHRGPAPARPMSCRRTINAVKLLGERLH